MRTDTARSYSRIGAALGMAMNSYAEKVHLIPAPDPAKHIQRAACGRQVIPVDEVTGLTECRTCWPTADVDDSLHAVWDVCDDWDGRYNGSIRNLDTKPLGSIFS